MTTVSLDRTSAAKFTPESFSWGGCHIYYTRAIARPRIGGGLSQNFVAGACRRGSRAG
ncbi:hypothetical protein [Mycobacterium sp.]|uniref:hypothetical protein n=1 Tax=Mycobacterium sp. TaxID=1785 RepID=UPI003D1295CA